MELKLAIKYKNSSLLSRKLKRYFLTNKFFMRNILINTNRFLFVLTKLLELNFKKVKVTYNVKSQTLYYEFIILN